MIKTRKFNKPIGKYSSNMKRVEGSVQIVFPLKQHKIFLIEPIKK